MSKEQRQRAMLGALLVVMLVIVWRQIGPRFGGGTRSAALSGQAASSGNVAPVLDSPEVVELQLADLEKSEGQFSPGRDPFRFGEAEPVQVEPSEEERAEAEQEAAAMEALRRAMEARASREAAAPSSPVLPELDVKFLGSFGSREKRLAVFSDGVDIFNVLEGGVLKDHWVVRQIGFESVDVGFADYPEVPTIRLAAGG
jgi:hypothetical protein